MGFPKGALLALVLPTIALLWIISSSQQATQSLLYKVLDVHTNATSGQIQAAYERFKASPDLKPDELQKVEHAFYVLSDEFRKRDYDHFGLEISQASGHDKHSENKASITTSLNMENLKTVFESEEPWLIQIYSVADAGSSQFAAVWERLAEALEGQVNLGRVELGEVSAAKLSAEKNLFGKPVFRQGLPQLLAFPSHCKQLKCIQRYSDVLSYNSILDWTATELLNLPRILYYQPQTLASDFLRKASVHRVRVIIFSETGERAPTFMREAAAKYSEYALFGCVLWKQEEAFVWESRLGVESAPAVVFLKDPGLQPVVVHGKLNRTGFMQLMEEHKTYVLPQLRSITSDLLGCNPGGYSMAGENTLTWYCAIAVGKPGYRLDQLRTMMRSVQDELTGEEAEESYAAAVNAWNEKRLSLTWLDGALQKKLCYYFLASEGQSSCGAKQYAEEEDEAKIVLIRFRRSGEAQQPAKITNVWQQYFSEAEEDPASLLIARYNGSEDASEMLSWMASTIHDGDTEEIPYFKMKSAPALVPEETSKPMLSKTSSSARRMVKLVLDQGKKFLIDVLDIDTKLIAIFIAMISIFVIRHFL